VEGNRLLIVEDDLATLYALRALFERRGWEVVSARTVAEAVPTFDAKASDWVILDLDLVLPDGDGEEVVRRLRESGRACRIAIAAGMLEPERLARLREWKVDVVMAKPIDLVKLYSACIGIESALTTRSGAEVAPHENPASPRSRRGQGLASTKR